MMGHLARTLYVRRELLDPTDAPRTSDGDPDWDALDTGEQAIYERCVSAVLSKYARYTASPTITSYVGERTTAKSRISVTVASRLYLVGIVRGRLIYGSDHPAQRVRAPLRRARESLPGRQRREPDAAGVEVVEGRGSEAIDQLEYLGGATGGARPNVLVALDEAGTVRRRRRVPGRLRGLDREIPQRARPHGRRPA
jgi:hypothetical protein